MGLWSGLTKIVQGKPVFEVTGRESDQPPAESAPVTTPTASRPELNTIPELEVENCESDINGSEMLVTAWVTNRSSEEIEVDKIVMLGLTTEIDRIFSPGQAHELKLYKGKVPTSDSYHTANLYYKRRSDGNYFCADFRLEYDFDRQGLYKVEELHPIRPIRDV